MLKKYSAILFLFFAYAILIGHDFIPHHHNSKEAGHQHLHTHEGDDGHHHSHSNHSGDVSGTQDESEKEKDDDGALGNLLAHFVHSGESLFFITHQNNINFYPFQVLLMCSRTSTEFQILYLLPPILLKPPLDHFKYTSPPALFSGLRAPPASIV